MRRKTVAKNNQDTEPLAYRGMYVPVGCTVKLGTTPNIPQALRNAQLLCSTPLPYKTSKCRQCILSEEQPDHKDMCGCLQCFPSDREDKQDVVFTRVFAKRIADLRKQLEQAKREAVPYGAEYSRQRAVVMARINREKEICTCPMKVVYTPEGGMRFPQIGLTLVALPYSGPFGCNCCALVDVCWNTALGCWTKDGIRCCYMTEESRDVYQKYMECNAKVDRLEKELSDALKASTKEV